MKKYVFLVSLFVVFTLLLFKVNNVLASTCTQSGGTTYCTDTSTGRTTTYNQYGNNIYGSDGSSYSINGDTTHGSGNLFNIGGNSGSGLPPLSTSGADMNSPEIKAAKERYDAACAPNTSGEAMFGGVQANNCREATTEWLRAVANSQKTNASTTQPTNYNSGSSTSRDENLDEWTKNLLSKFGYDTYSKNSDDLSKYRCPGNNMHVKSETECACNDGFYYSSLLKNCVSFSQICTDDIGGVLEDAEHCVCKTGYTMNFEQKKCYLDVKVENIKEPVIKIEKTVTTPKVKKTESPKTDISIEKNEEVKPSEVQKEVPVIELAKKEVAPPVQTKKIKWYQKVFNWFKGK